ncbi:MAG: hypothetical protein GX575_17180 [Candidatus Anammoximicrobium sp.]|nr:hypothetical protein [Candidatus Anammoximicrobium sp.]
MNEGRKLKDVVADLIRRGLGLDDTARALSPRKNPSDVPLFPIDADAPASRMTVGEVIAVEQQSLLGEET